jgi:hypothetical protein
MPFAMIAVLDLGAPTWLVVSTGVIIAVAGHFVLRRAKRALETMSSRPEVVRPWSDGACPRRRISIDAWNPMSRAQTPTAI